jgi:hypothetical protein
MASNINSVGIDEAYPVAGRDNDSQGFRDNFSIIKNNFAAAKSEVEDLQFNAARTDQANNFNNNNIVKANLVDYSENVFIGGDNLAQSPALVNVDYTLGSYHIYVPNISITTYNLINLPTNNLGRIRIQVRSINNDIREIRFTGLPSILCESSVPLKVNGSGVIAIDVGPDPMIFEFWRATAGTQIFMKFLGEFTIPNASAPA